VGKLNWTEGWWLSFDPLSLFLFFLGACQDQQHRVVFLLLVKVLVLAGCVACT
jgi:hypothetical protein